jgi:hypothetical protein
MITDHKPLTTILGPMRGIPPLAAARMQRWGLLLSAYTYDIQYRSTNFHGNVDGLSRLPLPGTKALTSSADAAVFNMAQIDALPVQASQISEATRHDTSLRKVLQYTQSAATTYHLPLVLPLEARGVINRE